MEQNSRYSNKINQLMPKLIKQSNEFASLFVNRIKSNKIFSEFETKASHQLKFFINESSNRYSNSRTGNKLETIINHSRPKCLKEAIKILDDEFYTRLELEKEKIKMKVKTTSKNYKNIRELVYKIREGTKKNKLFKGAINKNDKTQKKEENKKIENKNGSKNLSLGSSPMLNSGKSFRAITEENANKYKNDMINILNEEKEKINTSFTNYKEDLDYLEKTRGNKIYSSAHKKINIHLPSIKMLNYEHYKPPKRNLEEEERQKRVDLSKLLPYSKYGNFTYNDKKAHKNNSVFSLKENFREKIIQKSIEENKFINNKHLKNYHNTIDIVACSANKELKIFGTFNKKRHDFDDMLYGSEIPSLSKYNDIIKQKTIEIQGDRYNKNKLVSDRQKYKELSEKEKLNLEIDKDLILLTKAHSSLYGNND